jgi:hypothetical protein
MPAASHQAFRPFACDIAVPPVFLAVVIQDEFLKGDLFNQINSKY